MGFWDVLRGRSRQAGPNLDSLFLVPGAAVALEAAAGLVATGSGSVCFRAAEGRAFQETRDELVALLNADPRAPDVRLELDDFGFTWLSVQREPGDVSGICTDLHAVSTSLEEQGFGSGLLCALVPFADPEEHRVGLVYVYRRGTFYPFAPGRDQTRDHLLELRVRDVVAGELPWEKDTLSWLAVWGAPGL